MQDESVLANVGRDGPKLRAPEGGRVAAERSGSRIRVAVYGAVADDGARTVRTRGTFDAADFVRYPEPARKKRGRVMLITDDAPRHG